MSSANVPRNLMYDQTNQSTLAETLIAKQAPEGRTSSFKAGEKIDFRFPTSGGYVDSFASSTLDFDLDITNSGSSTTAALDPYLGAHQLIDRVVVTVGGNIIEDTTQYPVVVKEMKALHGHTSRLQIDAPLSEGNSAEVANTWTGNDLQYWEKTIENGDTKRFPVRLNLMSCLGSLSGSKYWPSALLDSDIRLEIYLNQNYRGIVAGADTVTWVLNNVEFTMTRVRLNTRIIESLKASAQSGGVKMIMPGFSHFSETMTTAGTAGTQQAHITKYSSSASSLKSILVAFRKSDQVGVAGSNTYNFVDPCGLEYQFLIGSTLMPARPVISPFDKYRELMRCMGGPINSLGQRNLLSNVAYNAPMQIDNSTAQPVACHLIGQSLEMYADHTLSSVVFSGINAINLTMQAHFKVTSTEGTETDRVLKTPPVAPNLMNTVGVVGLNMKREGEVGSYTYSPETIYIDSILVFDRLLNFNGSEVTMGY